MQCLINVTVSFIVISLKKILNKIVTPQVLGTTAELEYRIAQSSEKIKFCYVLQDASLSNIALIDQQTQSRGLPSVYAPLIIARAPGR